MVENVTIGFSGKLREGIISLICENPFFEDLAPTYIPMAQWLGGANFPLNILETKNHFEVRVAEQIKKVSNPANVILPLKITFTAGGTVKKPELTNIETGEKMVIDTTLALGDELVVDTKKGTKNKILLNGRPANNLWNFGSDWLQLPIGEHNFRYAAATGIDYLDVVIETTTLYRGA